MHPLNYLQFSRDTLYVNGPTTISKAFRLKTEWFRIYGSCAEIRLYFTHEEIGNRSETTFGVSGRYPKNQAKGEKRSAPSHPLEKTPKRGKGGSSPSYAQVATS